MRADPTGHCRSILDERSHRDPRRHGEVLPRLIQPSTPPVTCRQTSTPSPSAWVQVPIPGCGSESPRRRPWGCPWGSPCSVWSRSSLALASHRREPFAIVTDARRREVFVARYATTAPPRASRLGSPRLDYGDRGRSPCSARTPPRSGRTYALCDPARPGLWRSGRSTAGWRPTHRPTPLYLRHPDVLSTATEVRLLSRTRSQCDMRVGPSGRARDRGVVFRTPRGRSKRSGASWQASQTLGVTGFVTETRSSATRD